MGRFLSCVLLLVLIGFVGNARAEDDGHGQYADRALYTDPSRRMWDEVEVAGDP